MNGELEWGVLKAYFGGSPGEVADGESPLEIHRKNLCVAGEGTHAVLLSRFLPSDMIKRSAQSGEHAEARLLQHPLWATEVDKALANWAPRNAPMLFVLAINRSPCGDCAQRLANALHHFNGKYPLTTERQHFVLASLGYYHSPKPIRRTQTGQSTTFSTIKGFRSMQAAGWKLCNLTFSATLSARGRELLTYLQQLPRHE